MTFDDRAAKDTSSWMIWLDHRIEDAKNDILSNVRPNARDLVEKYLEHYQELIITRNIETLMSQMKKEVHINV